MINKTLPVYINTSTLKKLGIFRDHSRSKNSTETSWSSAQH